MTALRLLTLQAACGSFLIAQGIVARISPVPLLPPQEVANLEARVAQNPEDLDTRMTLLRYYSATAPVPPNDDPVRRLARLRHILYLVEHHPDVAARAATDCYAYRSAGLWANPADHEAVRNQWLSTVATHPGDSPVLVFAVTFLQVEDKDDAERALQRALDAAPDNREIAARLGFLYAMEILGVDSMVRGARPSGQPPDLAPHAIAELERTSNPFVLAAAGTALPNLAIPGGDPKIFEIASGLSARARELAPADDPDLSGPMPMIRYFIAAQQESGPSRGLAPVMAASPATQIRIAPDVQATKLIRSVTPQYPEEARKAGIVGNVVFTVTLATDGSVQSLQVLSGHRLLVFAATEALKHWLYKPTFLNNVPVEVVTEVTISFPGQ